MAVLTDEDIERVGFKHRAHFNADGDEVGEFWELETETNYYAIERGEKGTFLYDHDQKGRIPINTLKDLLNLIQ